MGVNDSSYHNADRNGWVHRLAAREMIGFFVIKLAFFHQNIFFALDTTERSQGLVKFIYSRSQPVFMENLRARNGETCQHRACGKLNGRCSVARGAQSRRSLRHTARCLCTTSDVSSPMSPLATIRPVSRIANF